MNAEDIDKLVEEYRKNHPLQPACRALNRFMVVMAIVAVASFAGAIILHYMGAK